jgi:hypothetical protein
MNHTVTGIMQTKQAQSETLIVGPLKGKINSARGFHNDTPAAKHGRRLSTPGTHPDDPHLSSAQRQELQELRDEYGPNCCFALLRSGRNTAAGQGVNFEFTVRLCNGLCQLCIIKRYHYVFSG